MKKQLFLATAALCFGLMATESASAQNDAIVVEEESVSVVDVTNCKTNYAVNGHDNWFIQLGAGISVPMFENELTAGDPKRHITATYNLGVGRWFSPYLGFRFSGYYGAWHWDNVSYSKARFANLNFDFMWDMCNSPPWCRRYIRMGHPVRRQQRLPSRTVSTPYMGAPRIGRYPVPLPSLPVC